MKEVSEQEWEGIISEERFNSISTTLNEIASTLSEDNDREITLAIQNQGLILENILTTLKSNPETDQEAILTELKNIDKSILVPNHPDILNGSAGFPAMQKNQ